MNTRHLKIIFLLVFSTVVGETFALETWKPVVVSPLIGDTLDAKEREKPMSFSMVTRASNGRFSFWNRRAW